MHTKLRAKRLEEVVRTLATDALDRDFMLTHEPFKSLDIQKKGIRFQKLEDKDKIDENEFFYDYVLPEDKNNLDIDDKFIIINGNPGTGKSHLIKWISVKYQHIIDNDVVCFISKNDNTLYSALQRIIEANGMPEEIRNQEFSKLQAAQDTIQSENLKYDIIGKLYTVLRSEESNNGEMKGVAELITNQKIEEHVLCCIDGPIERILKKLKNMKTEDTAEGDNKSLFFKPEDFYMTDAHSLWIDFRENKQEYDSNLKRFLNSCRNIENAKKISEYLNRYVDRVIQQSLRLTEDDLRKIFRSLRKKLKKANKGLALFIEDVTVMTGLDKALLNVLTEEKNVSLEWCRMISLIGITPQYFRDYIPGYFEDRAAAIIMLDRDFCFQFTGDENENERLFSFVARYLNAISMSDNDVKIYELDHEMKNYTADAENGGINVVIDGTEVEVDGTNISTFPFTKNMLLNMYFYMKVEDRTPRKFLEMVLLPFVKRAINFVPQGSRIFPFDYSWLVKHKFEIPLYREIKQQIEMSQYDDSIKDQLLGILILWGNMRSKSPVGTVLGVPKEYFEVHKLPFPDELFENFQIDLRQVETFEQKIDEREKIEMLNVEKQIRGWYEHGEKLTIQPKLLDILVRIIKGYFDWNTMKYPMNIVNKSIDESRFGIEGIDKEKNKIMIKKKNLDILLGITYFIYKGNNSWNYDGGWYYFTIISGWIEENRKNILDLCVTIDGIQHYSMKQLKMAALGTEILMLCHTGGVGELKMNGIGKLYNAIFSNKMLFNDNFVGKKGQTAKAAFEKQFTKEFHEEILKFFYLSQGNSKQLFFDTIDAEEILNSLWQNEDTIKETCTLIKNHSKHYKKYTPQGRLLDFIDDNWDIVYESLEDENKEAIKQLADIKVYFPNLGEQEIKDDITLLKNFFEETRNETYKGYYNFFNINWDYLNYILSEEFEISSIIESVQRVLDSQSETVIEKCICNWAKGNIRELKKINIFLNEHYKILINMQKKLDEEYAKIPEVDKLDNTEKLVNDCIERILKRRD